ncbi:hypothetical protein C441_04249 [Haloferax sulfurifontis ATCC BAA-897]|nr:hypothetical protein C441_04249 [Haloferax sulfurifontis ATCC BAA-897]
MDLEYDGGGSSENALEKLLTPVSKVSILRALLDARVPMNPTDICETAGLSKNAWYDNAEDLIDLGAVKKVGDAGNSPIYMANRENELVRALERVYDIAAARDRDDPADKAMLDVPDELLSDDG